MNNRILDILNKGGIDSNTHDTSKPFIKQPIDTDIVMKGGSRSEHKSSSTLKKIINESLAHSNVSKKSLGIDSKTKNQLLKDINSESHTYNPEDNIDNYQDIFSNSEIKRDTVNPLDNNDKKNRDKFFNNYLNI